MPLSSYTWTEQSTFPNSRSSKRCSHKRPANTLGRNKCPAVSSNRRARASSGALTVVPDDSANGESKPDANVEDRLSASLKLLLAFACGLLIANLYYAQPLAGLISEALGMPASSAGLLFSLPVAGYGVGILIIVPLADLVENRRLVLIAVALEVACVAVIAQIVQPVIFLGVAFLSGIMAAAVQVLVPYVSYLTPPAARGRAIGDVVSGLMLGIMLARPASSFAAHVWSWRSIFYIAAVLQAGLFVLLGSHLRRHAQLGVRPMASFSFRWERFIPPLRCCVGARFITRSCSEPSASSGPRSHCG